MAMQVVDVQRTAASEVSPRQRFVDDGHAMRLVDVYRRESASLHYRNAERLEQTLASEHHQSL